MLDFSRRWPFIVLLAILSPFGLSLKWRSDKASVTPICVIQGSGFTSPYKGISVHTQGIVTLDLDETSRKGFYLQQDSCDRDPATSDAIFVYLGQRSDVVSSGDLVDLTGNVQEYYGFTEIQTTPEQIRLLASNQPLPAHSILNPPFDNDKSRRYYESLEGMRLSLEEAQVVGPTDGNECTWLVRADLGIGRVFPDDPAGTGEIICAGEDGLYSITPQAKVGDIVRNLSGVLNYRIGNYCLDLDAVPDLIQVDHAPSPGDSTAAESRQPVQAVRFTVATYNLHNLFDTLDDPATADTLPGAVQYQRQLEKHALVIHNKLSEPTLIAVQEAENSQVLLDIASRPEISAPYKPVWFDGPDRLGLDIALLYRLDRVEILKADQRQGCTSLVDGLGPDGNQQVSAPQNEITCDTDGDGQLDGNRLFSRPLLIVQTRLCFPECQTASPTSREEVWLFLVHFKSKVEDTPTQKYTFRRRVEQARYTLAVAKEILGQQASSNLIVAGDLNDFPGSQTIGEFLENGFESMLLGVNKPDQYTYIYQGISQGLDDILVFSRASFLPTRVKVGHVNADYPVVLADAPGTVHRSSDHDPVWVELLLLNQTYLPMVQGTFPP